MSIEQILDTLIIHPSGLIEMPLETYAVLAPDHTRETTETDDLLVHEGL